MYYRNCFLVVGVLSIITSILTLLPLSFHGALEPDTTKKASSSTRTGTSTRSAVPVSQTTIPGLLLPHGDFAWDPTLVDQDDFETRQAANEVALGSRQAAASFWHSTIATSTSPRHTFLLVTPHGIQLDHDFGLYMAHSGSGTATIGNDIVDNKSRTQPKKYNITISDLPLNLEASQNLLEFLQENPNSNVSGIYPYNDAFPIPLNWGEIIPLKLLQMQKEEQQPPKNTSSTTTRRRSQKEQTTVQYMILSMPHRRYDHAAEMVPELLKLGERVGQWILLKNATTLPAANTHRYHPPPQQESFSLVISGDLSHTHQASGPYGYSNTSEAMDRALGAWASDPCRFQDSLLETARQLQPEALSCGFTGYVFWQGILRSQWKEKKHQRTRLCSGISDGVPTREEEEEDQNSDHASSFFSVSASRSTTTTTTMGTRAQLRGLEVHQRSEISKVYVNRNVTYYGMMAATFLWDSE